jgi:hypothetical protein
MSNLEQRKYYKLFTGTNQADGHDKIQLGYEADTTEIILKKDKTTYFHMPFFAEPQNLPESTLIADGAIPGPIPALADRIYKKLGNYGNTTPWGTPSERSDGQWLCSWLYAVSSEPPQWLDRYYDPGRLAYKEALEGDANFTDYIKQDPIYYDIPTTVILEPGVLYQYFHQGEQTALKNIQTFAGLDKDRLRLDIEDWSCVCPDNSTPIDNSIYNNIVTINNFKNEWVVNLFDPGYQDRNSLSFNNKDFINCYVVYNDTYNLPDEFTVSFWMNNPDWSNATPTQLVGNLQKGGYGVFYNNLKYNPFFAIPENTYGHLFYFNQEGEVYTEKNNQLILGESTDIAYINVNSNTEIVGIDINKKRGIKYNHLGDVITYTRDTDGGLLALEGDILNFILSGNNDSIFFTSLNTYIFDKDLLLKTVTPNTTGYMEQITFDINGNLVKEFSCKDIKFDSFNQKWTINDTGILLCQNIPLTGVPSNIEGSNTNIAIDPENNIWALAESNKIYKINARSKTIIDTFEIGVLTTDKKPKNISFINVYNRSTNSFTWYAVIYHDFEKTVYQITLDGKTFKATFLPSKLNILEPVTALQDKNKLTFTAKGDFTGYEYRRIFNKVLFNNNPQLQFKVAVTYPNRDLPYSINTLTVPVQYLVNNTWHLVTVTLKNNNLKIFVNSFLRDSIQLPSNAEFNYDFKNNTYIGCPVGKIENLNTEIKSQKVIWNGYIDSIRVYDYAIKPELIQYFIREKTTADDITWNIQTTALQYIETIDKFFKHRLPGSKSIFFNIRLTGTQITDPAIRQRIEEDIKLAVSQIKPAYTELLRVEWTD